MIPYKGRVLDASRPVYIYRNLHAQGDADRWSVMQGRLVVAHTGVCTLRNVRFIVQPGAFASARREGRKVVCAFAVGTPTPVALAEDLPARVRFDGAQGCFTVNENWVTCADIVHFSARGCTTEKP